MQQYTLAFRDRAELREIWSRNLSGGVCFLPAEKPYPTQTELYLILRVHQTEVGILLRCRVIQVLQPGTPKGTGMVVEFQYFDQYKQTIQALVDNLDSSVWTDLRDFSKPKTAKTADRKHLHEIVLEAKKVVKDFEAGDYYDAFGLDRAAAKKEIRDTYFKHAEKFHPDRFRDQLKEDEIEPLEQAMQKINEVYKILKDPEKRLDYDFSTGTVARYRDESKDDYQKKNERWLRHKMSKQTSDVVEKAKRLFNEGLEAAKSGNYDAAMKNIQLALMHDPQNRKFRVKLEEITVTAKNAPKVEKPKAADPWKK